MAGSRAYLNGSRYQVRCGTRQNRHGIGLRRSTYQYATAILGTPFTWHYGFKSQRYFTLFDTIHVGWRHNFLKHFVFVLKKIQSAIYPATLIILLITIRVLVHLYFSGVYTDGDQTITWLSAVDKADGRWYTPYFYGQFYNISITAIVSSPFIRFGFPVEYVVPIITNVLGLIPFLFGAWYLTRIKQNKAAIIVLCMGIILPAQYHFVTAMARGFVGGITVLSIGLLLTSAKPALIKGLGYGLCIIAYFVNPNMLIIGLPLALLWGFTVSKSLQSRT